MNEISPSQPTPKTPKVLFLLGGGCASLAMFAFCVMLFAVILPANRTAREEARKEEALAYVEQGDTYFFKNNDYAAALLAYQKAIELDPKNVHAFVGLGNVYAVQGMFSKAIENYNQALELDPTSTYAYYNRGTTYLDSNQYEAALSDFNAAYSYGAELADLFYHRAFVQDKLGKFENAYNDYLKYLELDLDDNEWTRYACDRVNWLAFWNSDSFGEAFLSFFFQPCTRFPVTYTTDTQTYNGYEEPEEVCYFIPPRDRMGADFMCKEVGE